MHLAYFKKSAFILLVCLLITSLVFPSISLAASSTSKQSAMKGIDKIGDIGDTPGTSKVGDKGSDVKKLQQALTLRGYFDGKIDSSFGDATENAVKKFQKAKGLSQDGVAGSSTIKALFGKKAANNDSTTESSDSKTSSSDSAMKGINKISDIGSTPATSKKGDKGSDVKKLQQALTLEGYLDSTIDSSYGDKTVKAVKKYQKAKKLTQDGVAGSSTIKALFGKEAANSDSTASSSKGGASDPAMKGIDKISDIGSAPATSKKGDKGSNVKKLQQALTLKGYLDAEIDSSFGDQTENAVKKYQKAKKLTQDGVAGSSTIKALFGKEAANNDSTATSSNDGTSDPAMKGIDKISDIGSTPATSKIGDKGSNVKKLQQALVLKGYLDAEIDSSFGDKTENAVKKFQKAEKLTQDGIAGSSTIKALFGKKAANNNSTASTDNAGSSTSSSSDMKGINKISDIGGAPATSKTGDSGTKVQKLQQALTLEGYYKGKIDGGFGKQTETAVKKFQKAKGMSQDGIAGSTTIKLLFGEESPDNSSTSASDNSTTTVDSAMKGINSISDIGSTPATSKLGDKGSKVKKLQQALTLRKYFSSKIDGSFGEATEKAIKKFQKAKGLSQDGVAGSATIKALFGKDAPDNGSTEEKKYTTEKLNWYNGGSTAIPKGKTFTVKDIWSGKTFECYRWSGGDHLDAEPFTAADTKIMKGIYGGSWSWSRRPILIKYGDHIYAASMNGMPHGTDTIKDNDFVGQFCIHFYMSKTHGTDKVDANHQKCIEIAAKSTW